MDKFNSKDLPNLGHILLTRNSDVARLLEILKGLRGFEGQIDATLMAEVAMIQKRTKVWLAAIHDKNAEKNYYLGDFLSVDQDESIRLAKALDEEMPLMSLSCALQFDAQARKNDEE